MNLNDIRREYKKSLLLENDLPADPLPFFRQWFLESIKAKVNEPNAMVLATVSGSRPSARVVLLKELDAKGFVIFTNYESRKGSELSANPAASLVFFWPELERQVRVEGNVERISEASSDLYFNSRPYESRVSALISPQSRVVPSREFLENLHSDFISNNPDFNINRPANWGGFVLIPDRIEFWQGRPNRLHDRVVYEKAGGNWKISRLAP
jgi:pyridoxamine 5'-phosphate oxidase